MERSLRRGIPATCERANPHAGSEIAWRGAGRIKPSDKSAAPVGLVAQIPQALKELPNPF